MLFTSVVEAVLTFFTSAVSQPGSMEICPANQPSVRSGIQRRAAKTRLQRCHRPLRILTASPSVLPLKSSALFMPIAVLSIAATFGSFRGRRLWLPAWEVMSSAVNVINITRNALILLLSQEIERPISQKGSRLILRFVVGTHRAFPERSAWTLQPWIVDCSQRTVRN